MLKSEAIKQALPVFYNLTKRRKGIAGNDRLGVLIIKHFSFLGRRQSFKSILVGEENPRVRLRSTETQPTFVGFVRGIAEVGDANDGYSLRPTAQGIPR